MLYGGLRWFDYFPSDLGVDVGLALHGSLDGLNELIGRQVFQQVTFGTGLQRIKDPFIVIVGGQSQHVNIGKIVPDLAGGNDAFMTGISGRSE